MSFAGHTTEGLGWPRFSLMEQMANIGSEVDRALRAHSNGQTDRARNAMDRALVLFDLTVADDRWRGHRRREILRGREEFCRIFFDEEVPQGSAPGLRRYFLAFAVAARRV